MQTQLNRVILKAGASYLSTRERPGFEIDVRSQRYEAGVNGTVEIRAFPKLFVGLCGTQTKIDYDKDAVFLDQNLHVELKRTMTMEGLSGRYRLTPLTNLTLDVGLQQDRFELSPIPRLRFDPRRGRRHVRATRLDQGVGGVRLSRLPAARRPTRRLTGAA